MQFEKIKMKVFSTKIEIEQELVSLKVSDVKLGFVPTMGALHKGHISLINEAKKQSDIIIVSIFVNPTQFNNSKDLEKYPRTLNNDLEMLETAGADIVFTPSESEIYPTNERKNYNLGFIETVMEGKFRPGHFNGVAQVVSILFDIIKPDIAFFGEKDFQQLAVIKKLVKDYNYNIDIVGCKTVREEDGLAMSSRNVRLSEEERIQSANISRILFESGSYLKNNTLEYSKTWVINQINKFDKMNVEYFNIVNEETLEDITSKHLQENARGCIAVFVGEVRLIDNIRYIY